MAAVALLLLVSAGQPLFTEDTWWHLAMGEAYRANGPWLAADPTLHTALLIYASDRSLVSTAVRPLAEPRSSFQMASLDHALWLHRTPRFDDWLQFTSESPVSHSARGLIFGSVFDRQGLRIASVAQEGLVRLRR